MNVQSDVIQPVLQQGSILGSSIVWKQMASRLLSTRSHYCIVDLYSITVIMVVSIMLQ